MTFDIDATPAGSSGELRVLPRREFDVGLAVPLDQLLQHDGSRRHVDAKGEGFRGEDHLEQARALATLLVDRSRDEDWEGDQRLPLIAGLVELEPWLHQWFDGPDPLFGGSPAEFITGFIDQQLSAIGKTRDDCKAWRP